MARARQKLRPRVFRVQTEEGRTGAARLETQESPRATPAAAEAGDAGMDLAEAQTRGPGQGKDHSQGKGRAAERPDRRSGAGATTEKAKPQCG